MSQSQVCRIEKRKKNFWASQSYVCKLGSRRLSRSGQEVTVSDFILFYRYDKFFVIMVEMSSADNEIERLKKRQGALVRLVYEKKEYLKKIENEYETLNSYR